MRLPFFPIPPVGETVDSMVYRFDARAKGGIFATCTKFGRSPERFGKTLASPFPPLLSRLGGMLAENHPCVKIEYLIWHHTAFPYCTYFDHREFRTRALSRIAASSVCTILSSLGPFSYRCGYRASHPRYCIDCNRESEPTGHVQRQ
jgi:hypothetical protein